MKDEQIKKLKQKIGDLVMDIDILTEGIIERFFRSLKEECVWQHSFHSFAEANVPIRQWIEWYNAVRPHQSLGYRSPREFRAPQQLSVA